MTYSFQDNECLNGSFDVEVIHKGQPFGLLPVKLKITKENCKLTIFHEKFKYIKKNWNIDVCREPVHIKKGVGAVEVIKKIAACDSKSTDSFCSEIHEIKTIIQDDGLIFAEGEKENIQTNHGKAYCGFLLLKSYLDRGIIFNRGQNYQGVLSGKSPNIYQSTSNSANTSESGDEVPQAPRPEVEGEDVSDSDAPSSPAPSVEKESSEDGKGFF